MIIYLGLACLIMAGIGLYSLRQIQLFHSSTKEIERESSLLIKEVKKDLYCMALLGKIDSRLKAYILAPSPRDLAAIKDLLKRLKREIHPNFYHELGLLSQNIEVLSLRMNSLKHNQQATIKAKNTLMRLLNQAQAKCQVDKGCLHLVKGLNSHFEDFTKHAFFAVSGQNDDYARQQQEAQTAIDSMIELLSQDSHAVSKHTRLFKQIEDACQDLSEALETIVLIREKTNASMGSTDRIFASLSETLYPLAKNSIDQNEKKIKMVFEMAQDTEMLMATGLSLSAVILVLFGIFLLTQLLGPIKRLGDIMAALSRFLVDIRNEKCNMQEYRNTVKKLPVERNDEIGQVARAMEMLAKRIHDLSLFRRTIEADQDTDTIYRRLSRIFKEELGLKEFLIMEESEKTKAMEIVEAEPDDIAHDLQGMSSLSDCRAVRTAATVNSLEIPDICPKFLFGTEKRHVCIPMAVAGKPFGVISFLIDKDQVSSDRSDIDDRIHQATNFINETLPILQAKRYAHKLKDMALIDQLTGLFNRRYLDNTIESLADGVVRRNTALGLLMCDMDFFKQVNDEYGHDAGDEILKQLSNLLRNSVRSSDIVTRFGGEEFLILLNDCDPGKETEIAEKIRRTVAEHVFRFSGGSIKKTVSIGTCRYPFESAKAIWEAIKFADIALYEAKEAGRNKVLAFEPDMWKETSY